MCYVRLKNADQYSTAVVNTPRRRTERGLGPLPVTPAPVKQPTVLTEDDVAFVLGTVPPRL